MSCSLKVLLASSMSVKPAQTIRMPRMTSPAGPIRLSSNIGNAPTKKIGSSGNTMNDSDVRERMEVISYGLMNVLGMSSDKGEKAHDHLRGRHGCHAGSRSWLRRRYARRILRHGG